MKYRCEHLGTCRVTSFPGIRCPYAHGYAKEALITDCPIMVALTHGQKSMMIKLVPTIDMEKIDEDTYGINEAG